MTLNYCTKSSKALRKVKQVQEKGPTSRIVFQTSGVMPFELSPEQRRELIKENEQLHNLQHPQHPTDSESINPSRTMAQKSGEKILVVFSFYPKSQGNSQSGSDRRNHRRASRY